jgi:tetratricopeptide (TPR) repeat protein
MAHYQLALAQVNGKDRKAGLKSLDKALALRPDFVEAGMAKALLLGHEGRVEEGLTIAKGLQAKAPKAAAGYLAEAELQFLAKKYGVAAKLYLQSAQLSDRSAPMANAYRAYVAAGQAAEGEKVLKAWLVNHGSDAQIRHLLALSLLNAKRLPEAEQHYSILTREFPRDVVAHNNLAWLQGELNNPAAVATAEKAHNLSPDNPSALDTLGWNLIKAGQHQRGLELVRKALEKAPEAAEVQWHLAAGLAKSGDRARARQELERLLNSGNVFPQEAEARKLLGTL